MSFKVFKLVLPLMILFCLSACGERREANNLSLDRSEESQKTSSFNNIVSDDKEFISSDEEKRDYANSSALKDTDIGLKMSKIDAAAGELTEEQLAVLKYFYDDYFAWPYYELLQRYPTIFENSQVRIEGRVEKILKVNGNEYEILFREMINEDEFYYRDMEVDEEDWNKYEKQTENDLLVIKGTWKDVRYVEGDYVVVEGKYNQASMYEVNGQSYYVPTITVFSSYIHNMGFGDDYKFFDLKYIRKVSTAIFGDAFTLREPIEGVDYNYLGEYERYPFLVCILDNQSNAKFGTYRFFQNVGVIEVSESKSNLLYATEGIEPNINRNIEFDMNFQHFFIYSYDSSLNVLTVECYDKNLVRIWKREFDDITSVSYDYTKNNIYLAANNYLYIIDISTGEDTFSPKYVGKKIDIRKVSDGILMVSGEETDGLMKTDLQGNVLWTCHISMYSLSALQYVDGRLVIECGYGSNYYIVDDTDGSIVLDGISLN